MYHAVFTQQNNKVLTVCNMGGSTFVLENISENEVSKGNVIKKVKVVFKENLK